MMKFVGVFYFFTKNAAKFDLYKKSCVSEPIFTFRKRAL